MKGIRFSATLVAWISAGALILMTLLICIHVLLRSTLNMPILGIVEDVEVLSAIMISLSLAYSQMHKAQVTIGLLVEKLSSQGKSVIHGITLFLSLIFFIIVTWQMVVHSHRLWTDRLITDVMRYPLFLIVGIVAFGFALFSLVLLSDFIIGIKEVRK